MEGFFEHGLGAAHRLYADDKRKQAATGAPVIVPDYRSAVGRPVVDEVLIAR